MRYVAFDIESTDGCFANGNLCEFGYVIADENFNIIEQNNILVRPITNNFNAMFHVKLAYPLSVYRKADTFIDSYEHIRRIFDEADIVVGHAVHNDIACVNSACIVNTVPCYNFSFIDTQMLYSAYTESPNIMALDKIATAINQEFSHHRADEDARLSLLTLQHIMRDSGNNFDELMAVLEAKLGYNEGGAIDGFTVAKCVSTCPSLTSKNSKRRIMAMFRPAQVNHSELDKTHRLYAMKISFGVDAYYDDVTITRSVVQQIVNIGARHITNPVNSDYHITEGEQAVGKGCKRITMAEFLELLGDYNTLEFDDEAIIQQYLVEKKAAKDKERIERMKQAKLKRQNAITTSS